MEAEISELKQKKMGLEYVRSECQKTYNKALERLNASKTHYLKVSIFHLSIFSMCILALAFAL